MKQLMKYGWICLMVFSILSCSQNKFVLEYSTTGCFGSCPIVDIKVKNDSIYINHLRNTVYTGLYCKKLSEVESKKIDGYIDKIIKDNYQKEYVESIVDVQEVNFILKKDEKTLVECYYQEQVSPDMIHDLFDYLKDLDMLVECKSNVSFESRLNIPFDDSPPPPKFQEPEPMEEISLDSVQ